MKTLAFSSRKEAEARSREEWEKMLGRPKRPEDATEFLWSVDGAVVLVPDEDLGLLTKAELAVAKDFHEAGTIAIDEPVKDRRG